MAKAEKKRASSPASRSSTNSAGRSHPRKKSAAGSQKENPAERFLNKKARSQSQTSVILRPDASPELFFGLIGPVGTDLDMVIDVLSERLKLVSYDTSVIHLSKLLNDIPGLVKKKPVTQDEYYKTYMDAGNEFRRKLERNDALTLLSVIKIQNTRRSVTGKPERPALQRAYILRSLKHHEEVETLRKIYGRAFFLIGAYAPRSVRIDNLAKRIAGSYHDTTKAKFRSKAEGILTRDEHEEEIEGQHVRNAFPLSDMFIDATSRQSILDGISRLIDLVFSNPFITPSHDEFGMYLAKAAAFRSADLSRQVGAVIATPESDIIGVGCNEVPRAFGGQYWENDLPDFRDWRLGYDSSARAKTEILAEVLRRLQNSHWLTNQKQKTSIDELTRAARNNELRGSQFMDSIEYGRAVHAEMSAIVDAARRGNKVEGSTIYSTTFPCHLCARHIIGAGIRRVVFIEPYPKSKVEELYNDSVVVEGGVSSQEKVVFSPFVGIAPSRYSELFEMVKRKADDGQIVKWERSKASPRLEHFVRSYIFLETRVAESFGSEVTQRFKYRNNQLEK